MALVFKSVYYPRHAIWDDFSLVLPNGDVPYHFSLRPDSGILVFNSLRNGSWGKQIELPLDVGAGKVVLITSVIDGADAELMIDGRLVHRAVLPQALGTAYDIRSSLDCREAERVGPEVKAPRAARPRKLIGVVESCHEFWVRGWVRAPAGVVPTLVLQANGEEVAARISIEGPRRFGADCVIALDLALEPMRFAVKLPVSLWENTADQAGINVQLLCDGLLLPGGDITVSPQLAAIWATRLLASPTPVVPRAEVEALIQSAALERLLVAEAPQTVQEAVAEVAAEPEAPREPEAVPEAVPEAAPAPEPEAPAAEPVAPEAPQIVPEAAAEVAAEPEASREPEAVPEPEAPAAEPVAPLHTDASTRLSAITKEIASYLAVNQPDRWGGARAVGNRLRDKAIDLVGKLIEIESALRSLREDVIAQTLEQQTADFDAVDVASLADVTPPSWKAWFADLRVPVAQELFAYNDVLPDLLVGYPSRGDAAARFEQTPFIARNAGVRNCFNVWLTAPVDWFTLELRLPQDLIARYRRFYFAWTAKVNVSQVISLTIFQRDDAGRQFQTRIAEQIFPSLGWSEMTLADLPARDNIVESKLVIGFAQHGFQAVTVEDARIFVAKE